MVTKVRCLRAPRSWVSSSLRAPHESTETPERHHKLPFQDAETPVRDQSGVPGECLSGHERLREDRIRHDNLGGGGQCPRVLEETASHRQPHSGDGQTFREKSLPSRTPRSKKLVRHHQALQEFLHHTLVADNPLVADAEVGEALVAYFNEKYRLVYSSFAGHILLGAMCHYFPESGKLGGHFLPRSHRALQGWKRRTPPRSRDPHVWCKWSVLILEILRHGHWSMGVYLLWMVTCYFRLGGCQIPLQGNSCHHQVLLYLENLPLRSNTYAANDTVELYCPWCKSLPLTAAALAHETPWNVHSTSTITTSWWCGTK